MENSLPSTSRLIIITTLHDYDGRLYSMIDSYLPKILTHFSSLIIAHTTKTHSNIIDLLKNYAIHLVAVDSSKYCDCYRIGLEKGFSLMEETDRFLYIDFDRLLHWYKFYSHEFHNIFNHIPSDEYVLIGRTPRALNTHPQTQIQTEIKANLFASNILNLPSSMDWIVACWFGTYSLLKRLIQLQMHTSTGFYLVYPVALWSWAKTKKYIEVEGQEWETPDRFQEEIAKFGYDNWLSQFQTSKEWQKRIDLMGDCFDELLRFVQINLNFPN